MAEFLNVNLGSIFKNQNSFANAPKVEPEKEVAPQQKRDISQVSDWAKELKERITENRALAPNERKSDYEVEAEFFEDYFNNANSLWDSACAEQLLSLGEPLKKALKVLGFKHNTNPILGFISNTYVINKLIKTKLLNVNTFKAIYNAVSKRLVASSEFMAVNDSNIIYCQDLYRRSPAEIERYLSLQSRILAPGADSYTEKDIEKNKKVFFYIEAIKEQGTLEALPAGAALPSANDTDTKLNSLALAGKLAGISSKDESSNESTKENSDKKTSTAYVLTKKIGNNSAQAFVAIQYLSATTDVPEARVALSHEAFKNISIEAVIAATPAVTNVMKKAELPESEIKTFIPLLLGQLERTV